MKQSYYDNKYEVFYFSKGLTHLELFAEFFFEIMNENCDPLLAFVELIKTGLKLKEYHGLLKKENVNVYVDMDTYREIKRLKEIKENHFYLTRSKRKMPKLKQFKFSERLKQLQLSQSQVKHSKPSFSIQSKSDLD